MTSNPIHPYYLERRSAIVADFLHSLALSATEFEALLPHHLLPDLQSKVLRELDEVLATLPYVGGATGRMTPFFEQSAGFFALGRVLRSLEVPMEITAALMRKSFLAKLLALSQEQRNELGRTWLSQENRQQLRGLAAASQERLNPGDFVYDFVESGVAEDGSAYEFGLNYSECGFCKMCKANGDEDLLPVMCSMDKESYALRGIQLHRSTTIAAGDSHCNFRFGPLDATRSTARAAAEPVQFVPADEIRARFAAEMSAMYRIEVPLYGTLLDLVAQVNAQVLAAGVNIATKSDWHRLGAERHGAIRVGTAGELHTVRRIFAVMGMQPVGYYDLAPAGVPVHSTAFRPVDTRSLDANPFRVFASLLRLELIEDPALRATASGILESRKIFTDRALTLLDRHDAAGGLGRVDAEAFVQEVLQTFKWHPSTTVPHATYKRLHQAHRLVADVVCFRGPHINHLTPRTLDIDAVQARMPLLGMHGKDLIEGPPPRNVPILLRQTSFKALEEPVRMADGAGGTHTARFGEVEQRGMALTRKGRALYDQLLHKGRGPAPDSDRLQEAFREFPDDLDELRLLGLGYFRFHTTVRGTKLAVGSEAVTLDWLVENGYVAATPITYEDFLPVSAAGIFQSNLGARGPREYVAAAARAEFENALGVAVLDEFELYDLEQAASILKVERELGVRIRT